MEDRIDLIGKKVKPRVGICGTIVCEYEDAVDVAYADKTVKVPFSSFKNGYVKAEDENVQSQILLALKEREPLIETQQRIHQAQHAPLAPATEIFAGNRRRRNVYFVFQGTEFLNEWTGWYLWAAQSTETGANPPHHWQRLTQLRAGDVVIHGAAQGVLAVSLVTRESYNWQRPDQTRMGWRVDCKGCVLNDPIFIPDYRERIIEYCSALPYQPFNRHGRGNQGYLFDIARPLAKLFLGDIVAQNPDIFERIEGLAMALEEI